MSQTTATASPRSQSQTTEPAPRPAPAAQQPQNGEAGASNTAVTGLMEDGSFVVGLGSGVRISAENIEGENQLSADLSALNLGIPGLRLTRFRYNTNRNRGRLNAELAVPYLESAQATLSLDNSGLASLNGELTATAQLPALNNPDLTLSLDENRELSAAVDIEGADLVPARMRKLSVTGSGRIALTRGKLNGNLSFDLAYEGLASGQVSMRFTEEGNFAGNGHALVTQPLLSGIRAELGIDEAGDLAGSVSLPASRLEPPVPGLSMSEGTVTFAYRNQRLSGDIEGVNLTYRELGDATLNGSFRDDRAHGSGEFNLSLPGFSEVSGDVGFNEQGQFFGGFRLTANDFPEGLPVESGRITGRLDESANVSFSGTVAITLASVGRGEFSAAYENAATSVTANVELTDLPGLESANVLITLTDGDLEGEADIGVDSDTLPGIGARLHVTYREGLWSAEQQVDFSVDDGRLHGTVTLALAQEEDGGLNLHGGGDVTAEIAPNLEGTLALTINPDGTVDTSGEIRVPEPIELFPEKRMERELFSHSQNIPLWAILVAVIRIRAGLRAGIGPGQLRDITVAGEYTIGAEELPSFSVTGELYIPAFAEAYLGIGAGLGLDVALGSLTGGIEGMATAGIYGAISVIPELAYEDGDYMINGTATLAGAAKFKLGLNAWAEIEALWVTVWEKEWELAEWVWDLGPTLALQARLSYNFSNPEPPSLEVESGDIPDAEQLIQDAIPKDGPPSSGTRETLENRAEWSGPTRQPGSDNEVPEQLASQAEQPPETGGRPSAGSGGGRSQAEQRRSQETGSQPQRGGRSDQVDQATENTRNAGQPARTESTVPEEEAPPQQGPRHPSSPSLASLDEPPVPMPRTSAQQQEDLKAAEKVLKQAFRQSEDSEDLENRYFAKIRQRYQLNQIRFVQKGDKTAVELAINPKLEVLDSIEASGTGLAGKQTQISYGTGSVGGHTVGVAMEAELGPDHPSGSDANGIHSLMDKLTTTPTNLSGDRRYIRGHLLNGQLGGEGSDMNLFPITHQANMAHRDQIENKVKDWVNVKRLWVDYQVRMELDGNPVLSHPESNKGFNYINSRMICEAAIITLDAKRVNRVQTTIFSEYTLPSESDKDNRNSMDNVESNAEYTEVAPRQSDLDATINEQTGSRTYRLNRAITGAIREALSRGATEQQVKQAVQRVSGVGESRAATLLRIYNRFGSDVATGLGEADKSALTTINRLADNVVATIDALEP
ncbi:DNA/RNA non-specific endonuclease [Marinobacter sp. TBZ242]|uniref:DNA/RNA non-specific endonuclease n=1 Tax=Marinobacter azerbaijanicus TaxID=3050455 RepID=A0ABT7IHA0_9GAMM|nr:DNA/RNA non-specific endonuclease [Marinobacter sp. TBZ242]MDL0433541.1 DNA/RNA non-specific endonuclease [Marinobacter sp. TBZ242]